MTVNVFDLTDTWADVGTTFYAIRMNVTFTAASPMSKLLDLRVGNITQFSVWPSGGVTIAMPSGGPMGSGTINATQYYINGQTVAVALGTVFQPLDSDLTSLAAASANGSIYYKKGPGDWQPVVIGSGLAFDPVTGVMTGAGGGGGGGNVTSSGTPVAGQLSLWVGASAIKGIDIGTGLQLVTAGPTQTLNATATGNVVATGTPTNGQLAQWTDATHIQGVAPAAAGVQPLDGDLTSLAAAGVSGGGNPSGIYYRKATDTWAPLNLSGLTLTTGTDTLTAVIPPGTSISDMPPATPQNGQLWWESDTGALWIRYDDGVGPAQWVQANGNQSGQDNGMTIVPRVITSSQTYTPTAGLIFAQVECIGGGAGGGASTNTSSGNTSSGGGGGSGSYARRLLTAAQVGASQTVTIGAGGASLANGGTTSFGTLVVAGGGFAGGAGVDGGAGSGGAGGIATVGDITVNGAGGGGGTASVSAFTIAATSGVGGAGPLGGSGFGIFNASAGANAGGYGGGGSGGNTNTAALGNAGGTGSPGVCIITEYIGKQSLLGGNVNSVGAPTANQVAVWTGATAIRGVAPADMGASKVLLQTVVPTAATAAVTIGPFTSEFDVYEIEFSVSHVSGDSNLAIRVSLNNTASFEQAAGDYQYTVAQSIVATPFGQFSGGVSNQLYVSSQATANGDATPSQGHFRLYRPSVSGMVTSITSHAISWGSTTAMLTWAGGGAYMGIAPVTHIALFWSSLVNFNAGGFVKLYGLR